MPVQVSPELVIDIALKAARAHQAGKTQVSITGHNDVKQTLILNQGGYCARFVRQVFELASGLSAYAWAYAADTALTMSTKLASAGTARPFAQRQPADILAINKDAGRYGHIAIYVGTVDGTECIVENTSSTSRGKPRSAGTKLTPLADVAERVTGCYRLCSTIEKKPLIVQFTDGPILTTETNRDADGRVWVPLRVTAEALGAEVVDHIADQGKVYVKRPIEVIKQAAKQLTGDEQNAGK